MNTDRQPRREMGALLALVAAGLALALACVGRGWINPEVEHFFPHYLSARPLPALLFDPNGTDWNNFQSRELSYLFDWVDCRFILACTQAGFPHFLSLSHLGLAATVAVMLFQFARRDCGVPFGASLGLTAVWLTAPAVVLGGVYYRSAKIAAAAALMLVLTTAWRYHQGGRRRRLAAVGVGGLAAALCDRQGFFLLLFFVLWTGWRAVAGQDRRARQLALVSGGAVLAGQIYSSIIAPGLIRHYTGNPPDTSFLHLPWPTLLTDATVLKEVFVYAPLNAIESLGYQLGNIPPVLLGLAIAAGAALLPHPRGASIVPARRWYEASWWLSAVLAIVLLDMGMALRQGNVVTLPDFQHFYYPLPPTAWLFVAMALAAGAALARGWLRPRTVTVALAILALSNLVSLPNNRLINSTGVNRLQIAEGPGHLAALRADHPPADSNPAVRALRAAAWPDQKAIPAASATGGNLTPKPGPDRP